MNERRLRPPAQIVERLRRICASLADSVEHEAWTGTSWRVQDTTFLHTLQITDGWPPAYARAFHTSGPTTVVTFQADEGDYEALRTVGHPYYHPVWRPSLVGVTIDSDTDWNSRRANRRQPPVVLRTTDASGRHHPHQHGSHEEEVEVIGELTDLIAGVPVSDLNTSTQWYQRFFGRAPDLVVGDEILWDVRPGATLFIEPNPTAAGSGHVTFGVVGLDELLGKLTAAGIEHEPIETYDNGVRHVSIPDPDGNLIAYAEAPPSSAG